MRNVHQKVNLSIVVVLLKRTKISFHPCCFNSLYSMYIHTKKKRKVIYPIYFNFFEEKKKSESKEKEGNEIFSSQVHNYT